MLLGEDRRRAEDERLLAVHGRSERGPDRDLGLAEADVAADEPVHRPRRLQILLDGFDRAGLVLGLAVGELGLEPLQPLVLQLVGGAGSLLPLRVERDQLGRERRTLSRARAFRFCHALPPSFESVGAPASAPMYFEIFPSCSCGT